MTKFAFITDLHLDEPFPIQLGANARQNLEIILNDVRDRQIDEIVLGGDLGENSSNQWLFSKLEGFKVSLVLGNHDELSSVSRYFDHREDPSQTALYYQTEDEHFRRIYMDSSASVISEEQIEWLKGTFTGPKPALLFIHHCIFPVASAIDQKHHLSNRKVLQDILLSSKVPVTIFSGHYHMDDVQEIESVTQILTPAVSYQVTKKAIPIATHIDSFGYRVVSIGTEGVSAELITF